MLISEAGHASGFRFSSAFIDLGELANSISIFVHLYVSFDVRRYPSCGQGVVGGKERVDSHGVDDAIGRLASSQKTQV